MSFDLDLSFDEAIDTESIEFSSIVIPPGKYKTIINSGAIKETKEKDGKYLALEFEIIEGDFAGKKLFHNFNLWNKKEMTVKIAREQIKRLCLSVFGIDKRISDASIFLDQECTVVVEFRKELYNGEKQTEIKNFIKRELATEETAW